MSLKSRLRRLEKQAPHSPDVPLPPLRSQDNGAGGFEYDGEHFTWDEYERRWPDGPKPLRWADEAATSSALKSAEP